MTISTVPVGTVTLIAKEIVKLTSTCTSIDYALKATLPVLSKDIIMLLHLGKRLVGHHKEHNYPFGLKVQGLQTLRLTDTSFASNSNTITSWVKKTKQCLSSICFNYDLGEIFSEFSTDQNVFRQKQ